MPEKSLEAKVTALEDEVRKLLRGSHNPHILLSLHRAVVELRAQQNKFKTQQKEIAKILKKLSNVLEKLNPQKKPK
jgi:hypothetical protein